MASLIERGRDRGPMMSHAGMGPEGGMGPRWNRDDHRPGQSTED
jgi:hypothetical protein